MTENHEIIPTPAEPEAVRPPAKWLQYLFYVNIAAGLLSLTAFIPVTLTVTVWISHILTVATAVCLYCLAAANPRYRKAAIMTAVALGLQILSKLGLTSLLTLTASILTIIASYHELYGHSEVVKQADPKLAGNWRSLFVWQIVIGVLSGFSSVAAVVIMVLADMDQAQIVQLVTGAIVLVSLIPGILRLVYLHRTIRIFQN